MTPWTFDAATHEPLGPASAELADVAGIHQHVGDLWAYPRDGEWHHYSRVIQADAAFAVQARNVYVADRESAVVETAVAAATFTPAHCLALARRLPNGPGRPLTLCLDASCVTCRAGEPCH